MNERTYTTPLGKIYYWVHLISSDAITLVFLPGLTADHRLFDKQIVYFEGKYNVLVWDAPGHAASWPFAFDFDLMDKARWLNGILEQEGITKPVIAGQSMGGYVGQAYAQLFPEKLKGFVSIDSAPLQRKYMTKPELWLLKRMEPVYRHYPWKALLKFGTKGVALSEYGRNLMRDMMLVYDGDQKRYAKIAGHGFRILAEAVERDLPYEIKCPALLICGEQDKAGSCVRYNKAWHKNTGIPLEWIKDAGHNSNTDQPELVNRLIERLAEGMPCDDLGVDPDRPFYILGLAPNAARLSVRFFLRDSFGKLMENVNAHYARLEIAGAKYSILPLWALLNATVRDSKKQVPSPVVSGATVRAVFSGTPYPVSLMEAVLLRIRAERNVTWERAAILKAYLAKNYERGSDHSMFSEVTSVQLNEDCNYMPYLLGRLFRVMEEIQLASMGWSVNRSIRDSYFNSAASTPRSVFGKLFSLSNYHLKKLMRDKPGLGKKLGDLESDLAARLTTPPPARFTQEETICFYLGYYHQCNGKKEEKENV